MQTEVLKVDKELFLNLLSEKALKHFKRSLSQVMPDSVIRQSFLANRDWKFAQ